MTQYDAPNQEAVGQPPPWVEGTGGGEGPAPEPQAQQQTGSDLDDMTKDELLEVARQRGVTPANAAMTKDEIRESIDNA